MKPAPFAYHAPTTTADAVSLLRDYRDEAKVIAGGQSLVPMLALRLARFDHLVDLNRIDDLRGIALEDDMLVIGAMTRQSAVEHSDLVRQSVPLLARAIPKIGHFQIRNRGTVGGSLAHADPASELPAVARCLDASFSLIGPSGTRTVDAKDFFVSVWQSAVEADEILTQIRFPVATGASGSAIREFALRSGDFALAGAVCAVTCNPNGDLQHVSIAFMGMGPTPLRADAAERACIGSAATAIDLEEIARLAVSETAPSDDVHASSTYRRRIATSLVGEALDAAIKEALRG